MEKKSFFKTGKSKVAAVAMASAIALGSVGGAAYAYKDEFTAKIAQGINYLATQVIFKGQIEHDVEAYGNDKEAELRVYGNGLINSIYQDLVKFKADEIARGKKAIDDELQYNKDKVKAAADTAVASEKSAQTNRTNEKVDDSKNTMNQDIQNVLNQIPGSGAGSVPGGTPEDPNTPIDQLP